MRYLSCIAALCFIITGGGHLITDTIMRLVAPISDAAFVEAVNEPRFDMMGRALSFAQLMTGFSCTFGVLMVAFGLLQWDNDTKKSYLIGFITSLVISLLAVKYFFIVPIVTMGLATVLYGLLLLKKS